MHYIWYYIPVVVINGVKIIPPPPGPPTYPHLPCRSVQQEAAGVLGSVVHVLTRFYTLPDTEGTPRDLALPGGVECWVDKYGEGSSRQLFTTPTPEGLAAAQALLDHYLLGTCAALRQMLESPPADMAGGHEAKMTLNSQLAQVGGCMVSYT